MSIFTACIPCNVPVTIPEMWGKVLWQDSDNTIYLNIKFNEKEQCDDYENVIECAANMPLEDMLARLIVEDDCGNCAINIIANICDVCDFTGGGGPV